MREVIAAPFLDEFLLLRPGHRRGIRLPEARFAALAVTDAHDPVPDWLVAIAEASWRLQLAGCRLGETVLVRRPQAGYARASWEITLGCNWACPHCYLGLKQPGGLDWAGKRRLLELLADAGVVWLQITGGEPTLEPDFPAAYTLACELGMMVTVSTNGSTLAQTWLLELFAYHRPYRIAVSLYGADPATFQRVTGRKGAWATTRRGIDAARGAGLPLRANLIVTNANADQVPTMRAAADAWGLEHHTYPNLTPTIDGGAAPIAVQAIDQLRPRQPFSSCAAGRTFFHVDPTGQATICKIERGVRVDLLADGLAGLRRLASAADVAMLRTGACRNCPVVGACGTCPPLTRRYQEAKAPTNRYCRQARGHREESEP